MKSYKILLISLCFFSILSAEVSFEKSKKSLNFSDKCTLNDVSKSNKERAYYSFKKAHQLITESQESPFSDEFKQGLMCLHYAVSLEPTKARYFAFLGDAYNILGLSNTPMAKSIALDAYDEAIRLDDSLNEVRIKAAIIEVNAQLYEDSLNHFEGALNNSAIYLLPNILDWMNIAYISIPQTTRGIEFYSSLLENIQRQIY